MDIDKIILKAINNKASSEEYEMLEEWKKESSQNIAYLNSILPASEESPVHYKEFDKKEAWKLVDRKTESTNYYSRFVIGALLILGIIGLVYVLFYSQEKFPKTHVAQNQLAEIQFEDNSQVYLNNHSELTQLTDFGSERKVSLSGEAFFEITPDKNNPFVIALSDSDYVKVIGTSFNLINTPEKFDLIVYSGMVELRTLNRTIVLSKNDRVTKDKGAYIKYRNDDSNATSWKTKQLVFEDTPLDKVLISLEKHYGFKSILPTEETLSKCTLRSQFTNEQLDTILNELAKLFTFEYRFENDTLEIISLKCN